MNQPPEFHADLARAAEGEGRFTDAAKHWWMARAVSLGHNRRDRYEDAMERCKRLAAEHTK